jgi:cytochrome oxidase Cu insertion factor (SCO1/SenC/PrrC family)
LIILVAIGGVAGLLSLSKRTTADTSTTGASAADSIPSLPEFVLEDQRGETVSLIDLHGTVWIADFISTRDTDTSARVTRRLADLAKEVASNSTLKDVKLVSFSVDPDFDRPAVLRQYASVVGADQGRWMFLTGARSVVRALMRDAFKLPASDPDDEQKPIVRDQHVVIVDRAGRVRGSFDAFDDDARKRMDAMLMDVAGEPAPVDVYVPPDVAHPNWLDGQRAQQLAAASSIDAPHDFQFVDRIGASGITFRHVTSMDLGKYYRATHYDHGTAVAAADVDGDGLPDLYFVNQAGRNSLYRNLGGGRFEDITARAGVGVGDRACVGASFADIDNDGDPDLFVTSVRDGNLLFLNDGHGRFTDITASAGVGGTGGHSSGSVFFDFDGDGLLDLFVTNVGKYTQDVRYPDGLWKSFGDAFAGHLHPERSETSILYHNLGGGRFENVTMSSGLIHSAWSGDATPFDYDGDGRPDLYVAAMQGHDELWHNLGGGHFEKRSRQVFPATPWGTMGVKVLDWNGDGRFDLVATDMHTDMASELRPEDERKKHDPKTMYSVRFMGTDGNHVLGNALFTNRGSGAFDERSDAANVETGWPWGPSVGDLNADGWPDLFVSAGMNYPFRYRGNDVLLNERGKRFANAEFILRVEPRRRLVRPWFELDCDGADAKQDICQGEIAPVMTSDSRTPQERGQVGPRHGRVTVWAARASRSAVILDLDGDGDLDIVTNNYGDEPQILLSDLAQRSPVHFLTVQLSGRQSNRQGLGAVVTVRAAGRAQVQVNDGKSGYLGQSAIPLYFGLGAATQADYVRVKWPTGREQTVAGPFASGARVVVKE